MRRTTVLLAAVVSLSALVGAGTSTAAQTYERVTIFGDSVATAMSYDPAAKQVLSRGIDLRLETATCRRVGDASCWYDGVRPSNVIERATELGPAIGPTVIVIAGYNDYESHYAQNIADAMAAFRKAGVTRVLWATLRECRQSYANMNDMIRAAAAKNPDLTVLDWNAVARQHVSDWLQPDGIHLTSAGAEGMAALIEDTLVQLGIAPKPPAPPPPRALLSITSRALPTGHAGRRYGATLNATGGTAPYRWARVRGVLPRGLHLRANGRVTGVPSRKGSFSLRVRVVDGAGTARVKVFSLRVS